MTMAETLLTQHMDLWTSAIKRKSSAGRGSSKKIELYGIKKLRELILELAVRGLLVPQDPNDEPASELLKKIAAERVKLVKEGKIKKEKPQLPISPDEIPHAIADGWCIARFGSVAIIERGGSPRPIQAYLTSETDGLNWIKISDTDIGGKYITSTQEKIRKEGLVKTRMVYPGDFLLTNSMSFGRPYITKIEGCIHDGWLRISPASQIDKDYLYLLLSSPYITRAFSASAAGAVVQNLNSEKVRDVVVLLPPQAEQHRIVAKVDELMALCDQLEQQTEDSLAAHQTLVETLLNTLTQASVRSDDAPASTNGSASTSSARTAFYEAWQRIADHFDILFTTEQSIDQLKQTILQLAVMGKLVPQDPRDEPASELLKKIAAEKAKLVKEGKIKKEKPLPPITEEETPFALPEGWGFSRLDDICAAITSGSTPPQSEFIDTPGVPYLKVYNIQNQNIDFEYKPQFISNEYSESKLKRSVLFPGDVVMNIVGPPLGKIAIIPDTYPKWNCNQAIVFFRPVLIEFNAYIYTYLKAGIFLRNIELIGTAGQDNISITKSRSIVLPTPPIAEQHRIVAKVDELMALCDQLKARLNDAQTTQLHLADAITERALA